MKKNKLYSYQNRSRLYLLSFLIISILFVSCESLLDEHPKAVFSETFYNTIEEVEAGVNAIYLPFYGSSYTELIVRLDTHTDWGYGRGSRSILDNLEGFVSIDEMGGYWNNLYQTIRNANIVIENLIINETLNQDQISSYIGEAKFLRAFAYFHLVRNYGGVPIRTEANMHERDLKKGTIENVYSLILDDLIEAENKLPDKPSKVGKPGKYAAKTFLSDVYLTLNDFDMATKKAYEVIQSKKYALVPIESTSDLQWKIFGPEVMTTPEEIFSIKYTRQPGYGNWILWVLNHPATKMFNFGGAYAHYGKITNPFFINWNIEDFRRGLWSQIDFGMGDKTLVCSKYVDPDAVEKNLGAGNDFPLYRFADALLIYAEASCMANNGPTVEGLEALNQVRRRAYGKDPNSPSSIDFKLSDYDVNSFQDLVLQERAYEFIFEGKRWYDLKRTNKAAEVIRKAKGVEIKTKAYLWPIPSSELNYNQALDPSKDQNPGY